MCVREEFFYAAWPFIQPMVRISADVAWIEELEYVRCDRHFPTRHKISDGWRGGAVLARKIWKSSQKVNRSSARRSLRHKVRSVR